MGEGGPTRKEVMQTLDAGDRMVQVAKSLAEKRLSAVSALKQEAAMRYQRDS